jgi:glycosyltransferase involved in cell wall biosynthesis
MAKPESQSCDMSVVIPVRDEEQIIPELAARLVRTLEGMKMTFEVIFVTDVNRDRTVEALREQNQKDPRVKAIKLSSSYGQHIAAVAGLDYCQGTQVVLMDGDLQDEPEDIPKLYARLREGFDVVYGVKESKNESWVRNLLSRLFVRALEFLSDQKVQHNTSMFRIMTRRTVRQLRRFREKEQSLTGLTALINYPTATAPVASGKRKAGETKYSFLRQINLAISFLLAFSTKPLRLISVFGLVVAGLSFVNLFVVVLLSIFHGMPVAGWATLVSLITLLSGVQLVALGTIGEYLARIFIETKNRPLYIVEDLVDRQPSGDGQSEL